jgi:benzoate membrane transport protein
MAEFLRNLRDLPAAFTITSVLSGLIVVVVSFSGPLFIIIDAGNRAGLTQAEISSWLWASTAAAGIFTIIVSLMYRQPVIAAFSTPGAALLVTSLPHFPLPVAVGAYLIAGFAVTVIGLTGLFSRIMKLIPSSVVMGMLAGVLFRFGTGLFIAFPEKPLLVGAMFVGFYVLKRRRFRAPTLGALLIGVIIAGLSGDLNLQQVSPTLTFPVFIVPQFTAEAMLSLSLPLLLLALTSQNAPGFAVLKNAGYDTPIDSTITYTGIASILTAFIAGHGINLAAITAAMVATPEAHPDQNQRYSAGVSTGVFYIIFGIFAATAVQLFSGVPPQLIAALSGLALSGVIISSAANALGKPEERDAGMIALLVTASGVKILEIGAPFWGLIIGMLVYVIQTGQWSILNSPTSQQEN